jgi:hypothetical protein
MRMTRDMFLDLACQWAFDHGALLVQDDEFLALIRSRGASDAGIERIKADLERRGAIINHCVVTGWADVSVTKRAFSQYIRKKMPKLLFRRAQALYSVKPLTATQLSEELDISERDASYILTALSETS